MYGQDLLCDKAEALKDGLVNFSGIYTHQVDYLLIYHQIIIAN